MVYYFLNIEKTTIAGESKLSYLRYKISSGAAEIIEGDYGDVEILSPNGELLINETVFDTQNSSIPIRKKTNNYYLYNSGKTTILVENRGSYIGKSDSSNLLFLLKGISCLLDTLKKRIPKTITEKLN